MNAIIKSNLSRLYINNKKNVKSTTLKSVVQQIINDESNTKYINIDGSYHIGIGGDDLARLNDFGNSEEVHEAYNLFKNMSFDVENIKNSLKIDFINSFNQVKAFLETKGLENHRHAIIFLEHDFEPYAYFRAYGDADLPILKTPEIIILT